MNFISRAAQIGAVTMVLVLAGCGGSGGGGSTGGVVIASEGGTVTSGNVSVTIPANALSANTRIIISKVSSGLPTAPESTALVPGTSFDLTPTGQTFSTNATLKVTYDPGVLPVDVPESALALFTVVGGVWTQVPGASVNATTHAISAPLAHFSTYGVFAPSSAAEVSEYEAMDLGMPSGDTQVFNLSLASNGIVGLQTSNGHVSHCSTWQSGTLHSVADSALQVISVNANGDAVGSAGGFPPSERAAFFHDGATTYVTGENDQPFAGHATGINDNGDYVVPGRGVYYGGVLTPASGSEYPGTTQGVKFYSWGPVISDSGKVIGIDTNNHSNWVLWDHGTVTSLPHGSTSYVTGAAISKSGIAVGNTAKGGAIYQNGNFTEFNSPAGSGTTTMSAVNDSAWAVGQYATGSTSTAFLYRNGSLVSLDTLVPTGIPTLIKAKGINNAGQIVAIAHDASGDHPYLLTPRTAPLLKQK